MVIKRPVSSPSAKKRWCISPTVGRKRVIISAPGKNDDLTVVMGVNHEQYDPAKHVVVSNRSCTTNGLAPAAQVLHQQFGIEHGPDEHHARLYQQSGATTSRKKRSARRACGSPVDCAVLQRCREGTGKSHPSLDGKLTGYSLRVPVPVVSIVDLTVTLSRDVTAEEVNDAFRKAATSGPLKGILGYSDEPLVSSDYQATRALRLLTVSPPPGDWWSDGENSGVV